MVNNTAYNSVNNANNAHYGDGDAFPVSASSHASVPPAATSSAHAYNTFHTVGVTTPDTPQPTIDHPSNAPLSVTSGLGPLVTSTASNTPSPEPSSKSHVRPGGVLRDTAPLAVVRPPPTKYNLPTTTGLPDSKISGHESLPTQRQYFENFTGPPSHGAAAQWSSTGQPKASTPSAINNESNSTVSRPNAVSRDVPASKPAQAPAWANKPTEGGGGTGMIKPVLKMRRTGQNSPLSPVGTSSPFRTPASLHQRNGSNSPGVKPIPAAPKTVRKSVEPVSSNAAAVSLPNNEARVPVSKPLDAKGGPANPSTALTTDPIPNNETSLEDREAISSENQNGLHNSVPHALGGSDGGRSSHTVEDSGVHSITVLDTEDDQDSDDSSSDDEIKYETAVNATDLDGAFDLNDVAVEANSSSDDTDSASEGDDPVVLQMPASNRDANSSFRQAFLPPDESDDYEEDDDSEEEEDASSISSSTKSSLAAEPTAALPSAEIQHQVDYPNNILEMATPDRAYVTWSDETVYIPKSGGALFPAGYQKCTEIPGHPWLCPVRSCRLVYKTHRGLLNHFKFKHKKAMFNDNMDGTLTLVGSYTQKSEAGLSAPVVVSRRPLDPKEPPMLEPSMPVKKHEANKISTKVKSTLLASGRDEDNIVQTDLDLVSSDPLAIKNPGSSQKMWEYIQPFLTVHKSIPSLNWVRQVIHLPRIRDIKWNEERLKEHPFRDSHPRDITALIVQVTGVEALKPCSYCAGGKGPFKGCILISPDAGEEIKAAVLSCANCYYHCRQTYCSHREGFPRKERGPRDAHQMSNYNLKLLSDKAAGRASTETTVQRRASSVESPITAPEVITPSRPAMKLFEPSEINNIEMASETRTYKVIHGKDGEMIQMHGALIPEKYDLDRSIPGYPWICPDRRCRMVQKRIASLGGHVSAKHRGFLYNDNLDGTLSQVGTYNKPIFGHTCPPLIVSKKPLDKTEPPMEKASVSNYPYKPANRPKAVKRSIPAFLGVTQPKGRVDISDVLHHGARELLEYMLPYLPQSFTVTDARVLKVFELPRVRSIKWRETWPKRSLVDDWRQVAGLLIHLVGVEHDGLVKSCTFCRRGEGPFEGCQVLPPQASYESHKMLRCCANCMFIHRRDHCSIKSSMQSRCTSRPDEVLTPAPPIAEWAAALGTSSSFNKRSILGNNRNNKRPHDEVSEDELVGSNASRRRSERFKDRPLEKEAKAEHTRRKLVTIPLPARGKRTNSMGASSARATMIESSSSALLSAGLPPSDGLLELEEWEIAPGRIGETGMGQPNNIAFSKSYLESNQMVQIAPELSFRVETVRSGRTLEFDSEKAKLRYCSLASGKLRVSVEGQPDFTIGTHGVFMIKPGVTARVQNRLYVDSILHVNAIESGG